MFEHMDIAELIYEVVVEKPKKTVNDQMPTVLFSSVKIEEKPHFIKTDLIR